MLEIEYMKIEYMKVIVLKSQLAESLWPIINKI